MPFEWRCSCVPVFPAAQACAAYIEADGVLENKVLGIPLAG